MLNHIGGVLHHELSTIYGPLYNVELRRQQQPKIGGCGCVLLNAQLHGQRHIQ